MSADRRSALERSLSRFGCAVLAGALLAASIAAAAAPAAGTRPPVPASLTALESSAEDLVDVALAHDRTGVVAKADALMADAGGATTTALTEAGVSKADITMLRADAALVGRLARGGPYTTIALAANAVSGVVAGLYAHFADPIPPAVRRLDYLDREAQLRSLAGQGKAVPAVVAQLGATWSPLRKRTIDRGGRTVAAAYARHVAAMRRLAQPPGSAFRREAVNGLNLVDELEGVFSH
jgi:hypothetical protein